MDFAVAPKYLRVSGVTSTGVIPAARASVTKRLRFSA